MKKISLNKFNSFETLTFNAKDYSKLKFGDISVADKYGKELAHFIFKKHKSKLLTKKVIVSESAYNYIKNAASLITDSFFNELNILLSNFKSDLLKRIKINRDIPYTADYGSLNKEERESLLSQDNFTLDTDFCKDSFLIFIDDVYISGTHHRKLEEMLQKYSIDEKNCIGLYYGEYLEKFDYDIEAKLNFAEINQIKVL